MRVTTLERSPRAARRPATEEAHFFMMNCLLYSRMEAGFPTNHAFFDEDVNVYLAGLLTSIIYRGGTERLAGPGAATDASLWEAAAAAPGPRERCALYRAGADRLLIALGVFRNARLRRPDSAPHLALSPAGYAGRGKAYYALARSYDAQAARRATALGDVLGKLSAGFERYVAVLSHLGGEHLNIFRQISEGEVFHLERASRASVPRESLAPLYDRFLDLYSGYLRAPSARGKRDLEAAAREIQRLDPSFTFELDAGRRPVRSL